jgi:hypothetical protein
MRLYELFDKHLFELFQNDLDVNLQVTENDNDFYALSFETHKLEYKVTFDLDTEYDLEGGSWTMEFALISGIGNISKYYNPFKNTGTGHAFIVYSAVWSALKQFIKDKNPAVIEFDADDLQRVKIYDLLIKKLKSSAKQLGYVASKVFNNGKRANFEIARADMSWGDSIDEEINIMRLNPYNTKNNHIVYSNPIYSEINDAYNDGITDFRFIVDNSNSLHVVNALELTHNNLNRKFPHDKNNTGQILIYPKLIHIIARSKSAAEKMADTFINCGKRVKVDWNDAEEDYNNLKEAGGGRIVKGVNTTCDVGENEVEKQAAKFGFTVTKDGYPPLVYNRKKSSKS